jgi:hypothetical protein
MERIFTCIRLGAVVLGSAMLGACASSYQQGGANNGPAIQNGPATTTVNGQITSSTGSEAYQKQVFQARDNKTAACLQTEVSSGKLMYHSLVVPSGSFQVQAEHTVGAWRCIDYGKGGQQVWATLDGSPGRIDK